MGLVEGCGLCTSSHHASPPGTIANKPDNAGGKHGECGGLGNRMRTIVPSRTKSDNAAFRRTSPSPSKASETEGTGQEKDERRGFGHDLRSHVERQRLLSGPAAEVLFVRQVELVPAGELAGLRSVEEQIEEIARRTGGQVGERQCIGAKHSKRIGERGHQIEVQARTILLGQILDLELKALRAAADLQGAEVQVQHHCAAGKGRRRVVQHDQGCRRCLREVGGVWVAGCEGKCIDAKGRRGSRDRAGLLARHRS